MKNTENLKSGSFLLKWENWAKPLPQDAQKEHFELLLTDWFITSGALRKRKETLLTERGSKTVSHKPEWYVLAMVLLPYGCRFFLTYFLSRFS